MQRLSIGAFSRLTHLSVKTLRYYHETGLLEPAVVDPDSGYRYYRPGQAHSAHLVRRFRDLGLPVADVKAVLAAPDLAARNAILAGHLDRMREQLRQTEAAVDSLHRMLAGPADVAIEERVLDGGPTISVAANVLRRDVSSWWWDAMASLRAMAAAAGLEQAGPAGGLFDDELFTQDAGHARVYLPVKDSPALDGTGARWQLPAGRFAIALHAGPHRDVDRTYAALGTYAGLHGRDGAGPVRERYLSDPLENRDTGRWRTEVCWPLAGLGREGIEHPGAGTLEVLDDAGDQGHPVRLGRGGEQRKLARRRVRGWGIFAVCSVTVSLRRRRRMSPAPGCCSNNRPALPESGSGTVSRLSGSQDPIPRE